MFRDLILVSSDEGQVVFDPFAGSGTTGLSCIDTKRDYLLMDNNPTAVEMIKARI